MLGIFLRFKDIVENKINNNFYFYVVYNLLGFRDCVQSFIEYVIYIDCNIYIMLYGGFGRQRYIKDN